jgi:phosphatidylglycerol lysyltransferase
MSAVLHALATLPAWRIAIAAILTLGSYVALSGYELLGLSYVGRRLSYRRVTQATWVTYGLGQSIGFPVIAGGAVRLRMYARWGIGIPDIARIVAFNAVTMWLGVITVLGFASVSQSGVVAGVLSVAPGIVKAIGMAAITCVLAYVSLSIAHRPALKIRGHEVAFPRPRIALAQVATSVADWLLAAGVFYVLLPPAARIAFVPFVAVFLAAQIAGLASHLPAGIGVFDGIIVAALAHAENASAVGVIASLAAYRAIYYVAPLAVGGALLAWLECSGAVKRCTAPVRGFATAHASAILAVATFAVGAMLLFSSATPELSNRERIVDQIFTSPVTESAYLLSTLVGLALLLISRGLKRRLDGAYLLTIPLLALGIVFSLLKGLDYEEATALGILLVAFLPAHRFFQRRASLIAERFTVSWVIGITLVLSAAIGLAIFSSTHVLFSAQSWSYTTLTEGTPLTLAATLGGVCCAALIGAMTLLRTVPPPLAVPDGAEVGEVREVVATATHTAASLALVGDKGVLFSDDRKSFLMYGVAGRSWVAMGDPVATVRARSDLARRFRTMAREHDGRAVFYLVTPENLPMYIDMGFSVHKIGETALIPLGTFSLDGGSRKWLRRARKTAAEAGCTFSVVPAKEVGAMVRELREVSNSWLASKRGKEKGFSLGYFDERYLRQCPIAVARRDGRVVAFANLWTGAGEAELSVDLMRYSPDAPAGIMDYLLSEILLWGKERRYRVFDLGMAPLAGLETEGSAPVWNRLALMVVRRGHRFYNFEGVRKYKEKFDPIWEGRYMAVPAGMHPTLALADVARLVMGLRKDRVPARRQVCQLRAAS